MPIYAQLMDSIKKKIVTGELKIGDKVDSERTMSLKYGISRMTVRNALKHLEKEGVLESKEGSGTYVKRIPRIESEIVLGDDGNVSLSKQIRQKGMKSSRIVISMQRVVPEGAVKDAFPNEELTYEIIRLSLINDHPYALQKAYIPCSKFNDAERFDFEHGSLYAYMQDRGFIPSTSISYLKIEPLPKQYLGIMEVNSRKQFMVFDYYVFDENRDLIEYTISYHHSQYTKFNFSSNIYLGGS